MCVFFPNFHFTPCGFTAFVDRKMGNTFIRFWQFCRFCFDRLSLPVFISSIKVRMIVAMRFLTTCAKSHAFPLWPCLCQAKRRKVSGLLNGLGF